MFTVGGQRLWGVDPGLERVALVDEMVPLML